MRIRYFESRATADVPAKIHQPFMLHQSPCSVPGTRRTNATPLPVSSALAGHMITCWRRKVIANSRTPAVTSETRIWAIDRRKSKATWPSTCSETITAARCSRGSRSVGSRTGYCVPRSRSDGPSGWRGRAHSALIVLRRVATRRPSTAGRRLPEGCRRSGSMGGNGCLSDPLRRSHLPAADCRA